MVDSGAFSRWTQGTDIDLTDYVRYIDRNQQWMDSYITLDKIAGDAPEPRLRRPITDLTPANKLVTRLMVDLQRQYARKYYPRRWKLADSVERDAFRFLMDYFATGKVPPIKL
jgi:hypothetical protein